MAERKVEFSHELIEIRAKALGERPGETPEMENYQPW